MQIAGEEDQSRRHHDVREHADGKKDGGEQMKDNDSRVSKHARARMEEADRLTLSEERLDVGKREAGARRRARQRPFK